MVPIENTELLSAGFYIKAGSRDESDEDNGVAHFLEHMMFKGTSHRTKGDLFGEMDSLGIGYNATTTMQDTFYYVYGSSADTKKILDIVFDIYLNPQFRKKEIDTERKIIIDEMKMTNDMPFTKLYTMIHKRMFKDTPLARPIIGTEQTINDITKADLLAFRKKWYQPDRTVFVIAGNFSLPVVFDICEKVLGGIDNKETEPETESVILVDRMRNQTVPDVYIKRNHTLEQVYVLLVFPLFNMYQTKSQKIDLIAQLLTGGFSSRLNRALREKSGIAYTVNAYPIVYSDAGIFLIQLVLDADHIQTGMELTLKELRKLKTKIDKQEMTRAFNITQNEEEYALSDMIYIIKYFGLSFLGNPDFQPNWQADRAKMRRTKPETIQDVAKQIFVQDKINLYMYGPVPRDIDFSFIKL